MYVCASVSATSSIDAVFMAIVRDSLMTIETNYLPKYAKRDANTYIDVQYYINMIKLHSSRCIDAFRLSMLLS